MKNGLNKLIYRYMISYLKGTILNKNAKSITLLVNGLGYRVFVTPALLEKLKPETELELHTYLRHKDDSMDLYGFKLKEELEFFELLLTVSGVGPKSGLGVLQVAKLTDIKKAILRDDPSILYKVSGVGKKTAERIVVELKNKLDALPTGETYIALDDTDTEAFDALASLGYSDPDIRQALKQIPSELTDTEAKLKHALKYLGK
jgi:holliday junction DNA helicase RuvA